MALKGRFLMREVSMLCRVVIGAACVLSLAACQQAGLGQNASAVTAPSSVSMKAVDVPISGAVTGEVVFSTSACAQGFTADVTATGPVLHMGLATWTSRHCVFQGQVTAGQLELTAANGDTLRATYTASCGPGAIGEPVVCTGPAVLLPGTGRFEHATGTAQFRGTVKNMGMSQPIWPGRWELLDGSIRY